MTTVIVLIIAAIAIFVYKMLAEPSDKQLLEKRKAEEKANEEMVEFKKNEMIFNQFNGYIEDVFTKTKELSKENLQQILSQDFPRYKNGDPFELYLDLLRAGLIESDYKTELYHKGRAFNDLRLTFPKLVEFLKGKWNVTDMFTHDMHGRYRIERGSISKIIDSSIYLTYFNFGVSKGRELLGELKVSVDNIDNESLYLYTKTERHIKNLSDPTEKKLLHYDYVSLQKELSSAQYQKILNDWLSQAKDVVDTIRGKP